MQVLGECDPREPGRTELARSRADIVGTIINGTSAGYPVRVSSRPDGEARRTTVSIGEPEEGWDNPYSVAEHEFGHMLGLVNSGAADQSRHEDPNAPKHCHNPACVMHTSAERIDAGSPNANGQFLDLDADCHQDLQALGGR